MNLGNAADQLNRAAPTGERLIYANPLEEAMLKSMGGAGKPSSGGVPSYKKGDVDMPPQQPYGEAMGESLREQVAMAPALYRAEASQAYGRPAYAQLESDILRDTMLGGRRAPEGAVQIGSEEDRWEQYVQSHPDLEKHWGDFAKEAWGGSGNYAKTKAGWGKYHYDLYGSKEQRKAPGAEGTYFDPQKRQTIAEPEGGFARQGGLMELIGAPEQQFEAGGEMRRPGYDPSGQFGGLAQYGADIAQFGATRQRAADIRDVGMMGQEASRAIREADPLSAVLMSEMGGQAIEGLGARDSLTARERRGAIQEARQAMEARGRQLDPLAAVAELENLERAKRARRMERRGFAQQTMGASRAMSADPFMAILGRPSGAGQQIAQQGMGQAQYGLTSGPQLYSPEAGLSYMLGQQGQRADMAIAQGANQAQIMAGIAQGIGSAAGGKLCWIAREVYGESNPKWKQFRSWLFTSAPDWFREWYLINGESVAEHIKDKPEMKAGIKIFMDSKLEA